MNICSLPPLQKRSCCSKSQSMGLAACRVWGTMPGYKQELANYGGHSSHRASRPAAESSLLNHLVHLWGIGEISASACQAIAQAAHKDGLNHEAVVKLASTGAWGTCPNNISRDLKNFITKESKATFALPHVSQNIPCWNPRTSKAEQADFAWFDPVSVVE